MSNCSTKDWCPNTCRLPQGALLRILQPLTTLTILHAYEAR